MYLIPLYLGGLLCEATVIDHRYHLFYCIVKVMNRYSIAPRGPAKCHRVSFQSFHFAILVILGSELPAAAVLLAGRFCGERGRGFMMLFYFFATKAVVC